MAEWSGDHAAPILGFVSCTPAIHHETRRPDRATDATCSLPSSQLGRSASFCRDRLALTSHRPAAGGPLVTRSARRSWWAGDDVTLRGVTAGDAGSTETDSLSVVRQRSDGVEQAVASHSDTYTVKNNNLHEQQQQ